MFCKNFFITFLFFLLVSACSTTEEFIDDITAPDYVNSSKAKKLEIPPDLSELETNTGYNIPGEAKSYKEYLNREKELIAENENINRVKIVENPDGMKIIKSGNLRWLMIEKEPEILWPHVKEFWEDLGFRVLISNKRTGIIETEWMDTADLKLEKNQGALSTFDKWLDSLSGFADKRKFRTRVELDEFGNTEIYISQRSAEASADQHARILRDRDDGYNPSTIYKIDEYKSDGSNKSEKVDVSAQREIDDYEIDSELLTRLMIKLGASLAQAKAKIDNPEAIIKTQLVVKKDDIFIKLSDPYDRAWRRLGLALDLVGFVTEDKNRSEGIYFVRYTEIELPKENSSEEEGIIDKLIFWGDDKKDVVETNDENIEDKDKDKEVTINPDEPIFSGIEAPVIRPIDEDYIPEEFDNSNKKKEEEETWITNLWPSWGGEDKENILPDNEKRYRVRIKPDGDSNSIVYLDFPNGKKNITKDAANVLKILNEYLK